MRRPSHPAPRDAGLGAADAAHRPPATALGPGTLPPRPGVVAGTEEGALRPNRGAGA